MWAIPIGLIAHLFGIYYIISSKKISMQLMPSYLVWLLALTSGILAPIPLIDLFSLMTVLGGLGIAEFLKKIPTEKIVGFISGRMLIIVVALTVIELAFVYAGMGQRTRELGGDVTGGILPDLGIQLPRLMGLRNGSGYSALLAGIFFFICVIHKKRLAAWLYLCVVILMVSRGPFLGLIVSVAFLYVSRFQISKAISYVFPAILSGFPILIYYLEHTLSHEEIVYLIAVSTRRFLHYMSFLDFGMENPLFGIGYGQYKTYYWAYFFGPDFRQWGFTNTELIREAHNFMMDIFGELGVISWLLMSVQVFWIHSLSLKGDSKYASISIYSCVCFLFLSGLSSWMFWFVCGFVLSHVQEVRAKELGKSLVGPANSFGRKSRHPSENAR